MLGEAQREQEARRAEQEAQQQIDGNFGRGRGDKRRRDCGGKSIGVRKPEMEGKQGQLQTDADDEKADGAEHRFGIVHLG